MHYSNSGYSLSKNFGKKGTMASTSPNLSVIHFVSKPYILCNTTWDDKMSAIENMEYHISYDKMSW